jgi:hypothetical protein
MASWNQRLYLICIDATVAAQGRRPRVFIASDARDRTLALSFASQLKEIADPVTLEQATDSRELPSKRLVDVLTRAIGQSDAVIALLSPRSESSAWLNQELGFARGSNKPIFILASTSEGRTPRSPSSVWESSMSDRKIYRSFEALRSDLMAQFSLERRSRSPGLSSQGSTPGRRR